MDGGDTAMGSVSGKVRSVLASSGLQLFEGQIPPVEFTALDALEMVESAYSEPVFSVKKDAPGAVEQLGREWHSEAERAQLPATDGKFYVLLAGDDIDDIGWLCVKDLVGENLPGRLLSQNGSIEFIAMSENGRRICAAVDEGDEYWVLVEEVP
ncbi:hypothetical protein [Streptomyces sp. NBC_00878]|uniref:hypothetical protein n=1 Tax=Streptomyces sp. NBC_00878 TaxID=2975854 RepID=UPI00225874B2|nr:hypothetical protein [Streptomyces sp. NBC_00878]MCX4908870.1 hypothetical protein [Streptomyces sp. NBC_00878]